jgi:colanic acid/amylovoran biosynthesis glycosyltransferase
MKVGFFLLHYPVFSETFVSKEILNLQKLGIDGQIVCEKQNLHPPFHPHITDINFPIMEICQKIVGTKLPKIIYSHFYWLFKNPTGYIKSLIIFINFINFHQFRVFIKSPNLAKNLINQKLDIIYVHEVDSPCLYGLICSQLLHIPCGIIIHTQYLFAQNKYLSQKIRYADFIIFQSRYSLNESKKITSLPFRYFSKCHILSTPGIDTDFFHPPSLHKFPKQIRLITIGRLEEAKGYTFLLKAVKLLKKENPDILLTIVGDGSLRPQFEKYISQNNLSKNIHLQGFISHSPKLIRLLNQYQYFILPSIVDSNKVHDVHPNVIKEAMSCGLIPITSQLGGIDEIINNKQNGFLLKNVTPVNIAKIIGKIHLLKNKTKSDISRNARQTIITLHQQNQICGQLANIFLAAVDEK